MGALGTLAVKEPPGFGPLLPPGSSAAEPARYPSLRRTSGEARDLPVAAASAIPAPSTEDEVLELIPRLRAYARALTRDANDADDLVQETLLKALSNIGSYQQGTMLRAWLFTIMRNSFYTNVRKRSREQPGLAECVADTAVTQPDHDRVIQGRQVMEAIRSLPDHYRETLILVVMLGQSYQEVAEICGIGMGTVKSRVNRARRLVMDQIGADALQDYGR